VISQRTGIRYLIFSCVVPCVLIGISTFTFGGDLAKPVQPREASFQVKNEFVAKVPKGAKSVRMWFAVPQEDAASVVRDFNVHADFPVHYYRDDWGNRVGYAEVSAPAEGPVTIREEFVLTRTEIRNTIDPAKTRPLTDQERAALFAFLQPSSHVVINDQIKSNQIKSNQIKSNQIAVCVHRGRRNKSNSRGTQDL
jgi:hypothetical protein